MKIAMRFVYQIIGLFIIGAIGIVAFAIFMLGSNQRWFARDFQYKTYFSSAAGLSPNMPVVYKGVTIGRVKSNKLTEDDRVEVIFTIFDIHGERVREGSLVEFQASPIGGLGGNQFLFHPGTGSELIPAGETIYTVQSEEGKRLIAMGLGVRPEADSSINGMLSQVNDILTNLNKTLSEIQQSVSGSDQSTLGRSMAGLEKAMTELPAVVANLSNITGNASENVQSSLDSLAGTLHQLEEVAKFVPAQLPQLTLIIADLQRAVGSINDVVVSVSNNPIIKGGIPERQETAPGASQMRNIDF